MPADEDEVFAAAKAKLVQYKSMNGASPKIAALAAQAAIAQERFLDAHRTLSTTPGGGADALLLTIGIIAGNAPLAFSGLQGTVQGEAERGQVLREYASAFNDNRSSQLVLASIAPEFSVAPIPARIVSIDLDESWAGTTTPFDVLTLTNTSDSLLKDCLVQVTLRGKDNSRKRNVHFVENWPAGTSKFARYGIGTTVGDQTLGAQTVMGVQDIQVSVWSPSLSAENITYVYAGAERDKDIESLCQGKLALTVDLYDAGFINFVPTVAFKLGGISEIPAHTIGVRFLRDNAMLDRKWEQGPWKKGEVRRFSPRDLSWWPRSLEVSISFPDSGYVWRDSFTFK